MRQQYNDYLLRRKVKRAVVAATEALYSEDFDMDAVAARIANNDQQEMMLADIAIELAAQLSEPITGADIKDALAKLSSYEQHRLEHQKDDARRAWERTKEKILKGKSAYRRDRYSSAAAVYQVEKAKKGPSSPKEREKFATLINDLEDAERELTAHLDRQASNLTAEDDVESLQGAEEQRIRNEIEQIGRDIEALEDPETLFNFGQMSLEGDGVEQNYVEAADWFRMAAGLGHAAAQHNLALLYENGEGVAQDYFEAAKWYRLAAEQGNPGSQNNLALLYETGDGVAQDRAAATEWYRRAAESGDENSRSNLQRLTMRMELERYREIVFEFSDLVAEHTPLIGDSGLLPHSKATILYAIKFVVDDYEAKREAATDRKLVESYEKTIPTLNYLFTHLARDWCEIANEDKDAIARLSGYTSFPDWALPLKIKYIDDERGSMEAFEAAFRVLKDKGDQAKIGSNAQDLS